MGIALEVLLPPFAACLILTGIHTYLGLHVVSRGVIFVDLALAQIAALGVTFAFLLGHDPSSTQGYVYSLVFTFAGAAVFSLSRLRDERIPQEAIIGITFAVSSAAAILIADRAPSGAEHVEAMLTGALLWVPWPTIAKTGAIYVLIGLFHWIFRHRFLTISLDPARAEAERWHVRWWDFLFYTSFGFVITSSVAIAGVLLVFSFLIIPSVIGVIFAGSIRGRLLIGWSVGAAVSMIGLTLSYGYDFPSGPAVVVTFGGALLAASIIRYLLVAESRMAASTKTTAVSAVVLGGFWLSFLLAERLAPDTSGGEYSEEVAAAIDPVEGAREALAALARTTGEPPPGAVSALVAVREDIHRLMATGEVEVEESAVAALGRSRGNGAVEELLEEIAHHAENAWARLRGAEALVSRGNAIGIEALIELLDAELPPFLQMQAAERLREATGEDFGFDPQADRETKSDAVRRWRQWWRSHRGEALPGTREP